MNADLVYSAGIGIPPGPKKVSPAKAKRDLRRRLKQNDEDITAATRARQAALREGRGEFAAERLESRKGQLYGDKRQIIVEVRDELRLPEARSFRPGIPGGRD